MKKYTVYCIANKEKNNKRFEIKRIFAIRNKVIKE